MPDYSDWPQQEDVQLLLDSCNVTTRLSDADFATRVALVRDDVIADIFKLTHRQFVADGGDTFRYYDGSGTAEQEVDEMVSLSSVTIIGLQSDPGYTLDNVVLTEEQSLPKTRLIVAQGSLPAYATNAAFLPYRTIFPIGRRNIKVSGKFGYDDTIPSNMWNAACSEMAYRITQEVLFRPTGGIEEQKFDTITTKYRLHGAEYTGWHTRFLAATGKKGYRRPMGRYLRNQSPRMI